MAYSTSINLVKDDTKPVLTITLKDSNTAAAGKTLDENDDTTWAPIDLTGATVRMRIRAVGSTTVKATKTCSLVGDGTTGKVTTDLSDGGSGSIIDETGVFEGEIEITDSGGGIQTVYDLIKLNVRGDFDT